MEENTNVNVDEEVVLSKFEGDALPENEVERLTIKNGLVLSHDQIRHGKPAGPVEEGSLVGTDIGRLIPLDEGVS